MLFCHIWAKSLFCQLLTALQTGMETDFCKDGWGCKWNWTGMGGVKMKVAVTGGHGCNLSLYRSLVALTMLVTVTVTLRLLAIELTCLHVHYWQEAGIKITHGSPPSCHILGLYGYIYRFQDQKTSKSPILANIRPSIHEPLARFSQSLYGICTLQVYIIY